MEWLKSPLNYSGSKNYIVDQIVELIPEGITTFVDAMGGAFNVGINVRNVKRVVYNEFNPFVYEVVDMLLKTDKEETIQQVDEIIERFGLEKSNKEKYLIYRDYYNKNKCAINLFVLQMYCFQNQLRFNGKHDFNTPVGNCGCNETTYERIRAFKPFAEEYVTMNKDCIELSLETFEKSTLFYFDPPYIITNAAYNDGKRGFKGWDEKQELLLLEFLNDINKNGQFFMLSNVIHHNGKTNDILLNWAKENDYVIVYLKPHGGRYGSREEVIIKNF